MVPFPFWRQSDHVQLMVSECRLQAQVQAPTSAGSVALVLASVWSLSFFLQKGSNKRTCLVET